MGPNMMGVGGLTVASELSQHSDAIEAWHSQDLLLLFPSGTLKKGPAPTNHKQGALRRGASQLLVCHCGAAEGSIDEHCRERMTSGGLCS